MVKQIRNGDLVERLIDRGDSYFHWLQKKSGLSGHLSSMLADTVFVSVGGLDDVLMKKAKEETRQAYAEDILGDEADAKMVETVIKSIRGDCCLFEVIYCLACAVNEMFDGTVKENGVAHFFGILMKNAGFDLYDDEDLDTIGDQVTEYWQRKINTILERSYDDTGIGGLFPLSNLELYSDNTVTYTDRRALSLWQQLNDWVDLHTNEDGEWID